MSEWMPIESAPGDGRWFVTANANCEGEFEIAQYQPRYWRHYDDAGNGLLRPRDELFSEFTGNNFHRATHWMPLPAPPTNETKA